MHLFEIGNIKSFRGYLQPAYYLLLDMSDRQRSAQIGKGLYFITLDKNSFKEEEGRKGVIYASIYQ